MESSPTDATVPAATQSDNQAVDSPLTDFRKNVSAVWRD